MSLHFEWIQALREECVRHNVSFTFIETGTHFVKDGRHYRIPSKTQQSRIAYKSKMNFEGRQFTYHLYDAFGQEIPEDKRYHPEFSAHCQYCASRPICNGCSFCGRCGEVIKR